jgi:hypothetical protein
MSSRVSITRRIVVFAVVALMAGTLAFAQGGGSSSRLSGTVTDSSGGVMPGVDVVAKNGATNETYTAVTAADGRFTIPALPPGTYTVTVALSGFKTVVLPDVVLVTNTPVAVKAVLEVGQLQETVVVTGAAEVVQTQSAEVQTTVTIKQMNSLPVVSRTALDYVVSLPGVETAASNTRGSVVNGLPASSMNITLDGVNVQDKRSNTEGFFMYIRPLMDSVEEISVSTSNPGAEASGSGASQIRMTTRAGTNRFSGSVYDTWRNQAGTSEEDVLTRKQHSKWLWGLNSPYWFNKRDQPKTAAGDYFINDIRLKTPGFRVGGPIVKDKIFYFFNQEWFLLPDSRSRTRYLLNTKAQAGTFTYPATDGSGNRTINLLTLAASKGQVSTLDPSISKLLADIRAASATTGAVSAADVNVDQFDYSVSATQKRYFPTLRLDYNVTAAHRVSFVARYNDFNSTPDLLNNAEANWPDFPNYGSQISGRYMWQGTVRSTIGKNMVNEARVGVQDATGGGTYFGKGVDSSQFNCTGIGCQQAGGKGWYFTLPSTTSSAFSRSLNNAAAYEASSSGVAAQWTLEDTVNWIKGKHSFTSGFSYTQIKTRQWNSTPMEAYLYFGTPSVDPAYGMLDATSGNFPGGITPAYATYARTLYGLLTGRVTGFEGYAYLQPDGTYKYQGERSYHVNAKDVGLFFSDSWRLKPNLTLNLGARYELQLPMFAPDGFPSQLQSWQMVYGVTGAGSGSLGQGNLYKPGTLTGAAPVIGKYDGAATYDTDWNNLSPSVGVAWRPQIASGWLSAILSKDPVFRGGYSMTFTKFGTAFSSDSLGNLPGRSRSGERYVNQGIPNLGQDTVGGPTVFPVLLRDTSRLFPSAYPASLSFPVTPTASEAVDAHYPTQNAPHTHQYSFGFQRALGKSMAVEARYVGNTNYGLYQTWNLNANAQWSMLKGENGFYDEFRLAQQNLRSNIINGKGNTFAYTGVAGTSPLPIFMAFLKGIPLSDAKNQDPAQYVGVTQFSASSWYNALSMYSPNLGGISGTGSSGLQQDALMANAAKAGLPVNFFMANPANKFAASNLRTTNGGSRYNAIQLDVRRQMSKGLLVQAGYAYSFGRKSSYQPSLRQDWFFDESTGGPDHSLKANWAYELPFGQGKTWGSGAGRWKEALIGGWEIDGVFRIQTGAKFNYGGYRLVGMSEQEFQDMFKFYHIPDATTGLDRIYMLPEDVIKNSILAIYTASATTASGYAGALPTGKYIAPASGPDCVQYLAGMCPGTATARIISGPKYAKLDMSFVKRFSLPKNMKIEARMDLYNVTDAINFNATNSMNSSFTGWQVTSAANDLSAAQDPGGRVTQFGLRFIW